MAKDKLSNFNPVARQEAIAEIKLRRISQVDK
jgi:hypothetical protein